MGGAAAGDYSGDWPIIREIFMSPRPTPPAPPRSNAPVNPDREYQQSTESQLDRSKPSSHEDEQAAVTSHRDAVQTSIGKP